VRMAEVEDHDTPRACAACGRPLPPAKLSAKGLPIGRPRTRCEECAHPKAARQRRSLDASGPCRHAAEATIEALRAAGHLVPADSSRVAGLLAAATAVDSDPLNAALLREHRQAEVALRLSGASVQEIDAYSSLIARLDQSGGDS